MAAIQLQGLPGQMACVVTSVPAFPAGRFALGYPEAIGDADAPHWFGAIAPAWAAVGDGAWTARGEKPGALSYTVTITPYDDHVDATYQLANLGEKPWRQGMAFNCFQCGGAPELRDHDCLRHWVGVRGLPTRLAEVPRVFGPRPAIQLYSVRGAPAGADIRFVANFAATPADVVLDGWLAVVARDGRRLAAALSSPALFLFQNREYSCIHSGNGFGPVPPGATATALNRVYFVEATLDQWHRRAVAEFPASAGPP